MAWDWKWARKNVLWAFQGRYREPKMVVLALGDNLIEHGLVPKSRYLFIVFGSKAFSEPDRRNCGTDIPIQRYQIRNPRNFFSPAGQVSRIREHT